jgi:hypothetical protein
MFHYKAYNCRDYKEKKNGPGIKESVKQHYGNLSRRGQIGRCERGRCSALRRIAQGTRPIVKNVM